MSSLPQAPTWLSARVSIYRRTSDTKGKVAPLGAVLEGVKSGKWRVQVDKARAKIPKAEAAYRAAKAALTGVAFGGVFSPTRGNANLSAHSGVLVLDFDHLENAAALRELAALNPSTLAAFLSPSREGFKVLVALSPVPADADEHEAAWRDVSSTYAEALGEEVDESGKDVSRLCFVSYDSDAYIADVANVTPFAWEADEEAPVSETGAPAPAPAPAAEAVPTDSGSAESGDVPQLTVDLSALANVEPPADYNEWLGWLPRLKALGFAVGEVESWSARGEKHKPGEVKARWAGLQADTEDAARNVLYKAAKAAGWRKPRRHRAKLAESPASGRVGAINYPELADNEVGNAWRLLGLYGSRMLLAAVESEYSSVYALDAPTGLWREDIERLLKWHDLTCRAWLLKAVEMHAKGHLDPQEANRLIRHLHTEQSRSNFAGVRDHCGAVAEEMQESDLHLDRERASKVSRCHSSDFDRPRGTLAVGNGLVDLTTGQLLPLEKAKERRAKHRPKAVNYRPGATHSAVDKLFSHLDPQRAAYLKACLGRALWGQPDKMFLILVGPKNSGKGTLFLALRAALGSAGFAENVSEDLLRGMSKQNKTGPTEERRALVECRIVLAEESSDWAISVERLKAFSGGVPEITYQPKHKKEVTRPVTATILLSANRMPRVGLDDEAQVDRFRYIAYTPPGEKDPKLKAAFSPETIDPKAAEGMLALLVKLARENPPGRDIPIPPVVQADIREAVEAERTAFQEWLVKAVHRTRGANITTGLLWDAWVSHNDQDDTRDPIGGQRRDDVSKAFRQCFSAEAPKSVRAGGKVGKGWRGFDLVAGCDRPDFLDDTDTCVTCGQLPQTGTALSPAGVCIECLMGPRPQEGSAPNALLDLQDVLPRLEHAPTRRLVDMVELIQELLFGRQEDVARSQLRLPLDADYWHGGINDMFAIVESEPDIDVQIEGMDVMLAATEKILRDQGEGEFLEQHKRLMRASVPRDNLSDDERERKIKALQEAKQNYMDPEAAERARAREQAAWDDTEEKLRELDAPAPRDADQEETDGEG